MSDPSITIPPNAKYCLSVSEAAKYISIGESSMGRIVNRPDFQYVVRRVGGRVLIHRESLERWVDEHASTNLDTDAA